MMAGLEKAKQHAWTEADTERLLQCRAGGMSVAKMAESIGVPRGTIYHHLHAMGLFDRAKVYRWAREKPNKMITEMVRAAIRKTIADYFREARVNHIPNEVRFEADGVAVVVSKERIGRILELYESRYGYGQQSKVG